MTIEIDINDRTPPTPCKTEGCDHPRFHVCLFGKEDLFPRLLRQLVKKQDRRFGGRSQAHKEALSRASNVRWSAYYRANKERDDAIIERYSKGDIGMKPLADEFGLKYGNVRMILQRAATEGRITINTKGVKPPNSGNKIA